MVRFSEPIKSNKYLFSVLSLSFLLFIAIPAITLAETLSLTLSDALSIAIKENKTLNFYDLGKVISEKDVDSEKSIYVPTLNGSLSSKRFKWDTLTLDNYYEREIDDYFIALKKKHSFGGSSSLNFSTQKDDITYFTSAVNVQEYTSSIYMKYEQPLLKGYGPGITNLGIDKALINRDLAIQKFEDMKSNILFNVFRDFFSLYKVAGELSLKQEIKKNTAELSRMVRAKVEARKLPITELNTIIAALFIQDKQILDLENRRKQYENQLMLSIYNDPKTDTIKEVELLTSPKDILAHFSEPIISNTRERMIDADITLMQHTSELHLFEKDKDKAQDDLKPDLALGIELGFDGYAFDEMSESIGNISSDNYRVLFTGTFSFPIKNTAAKSELAKKEGRIKQTEIQMSNRKNELNNLVNELFSDFDTVVKKIELNKKIVAISKENLDNEIERLVGEKSTALNTLDYQTDYINAQLDMLSTETDYMILIGTDYLYRREMEVLLSELQ